MERSIVSFQNLGGGGFEGAERNLTKILGKTISNVGACPAEGQLNCGVVDLCQVSVKVTQQP